MSKLKSKQAVKPPCLIFSSKQLANRLYSYISMLACYILSAEKWQKRCPLTYMHQYKCPSKEYLNPITFCEVNNTIKPLTHNFSFKNMTAICWCPPPSVCWQVEVRVLSFLIRWERRKYSRFCHVIGWGRHRSFRDIFGGGAFQVHFHFTAPNLLELSHVRQGVRGHAFQNDHAFAHTGLNVQNSRLFQSTRTCRKSQDHHVFLLVVHCGRIDTGSVDCICIGCILSLLLFAELCILFKTSVINEIVSHT